MGFCVGFRALLEDWLCYLILALMERKSTVWEEAKFFDVKEQLF